MEIIKYPNDILNQVCVDVLPEEMDETLQKTMDEMIETMIVNKGIGLSAPQIGVSKRYCVIHILQLKTPPIYMINPVITQFSEEKIKGKEACLSFPNEETEIERSVSLTITCLNNKFEQTTLKLNGLFAICAQHEIDHLNGITINNRRQ